MRLFLLIPIFSLALFFCFPLIQGQQPYIGLDIYHCPKKGNPNSIRGYTCNGVAHSCQAYLTFRSQPLYKSVSTISALLGSDPSQLSEINSVSLNATFPQNQTVIVPVNCSCASDYYQTNTSYTVHSTETYFLIANNAFQGLSTCQALTNQNDIPGDLFPGTKLTVPLRCACPTKNQTDKGVKYLLSYLVNWGNSVSVISERFGVPTGLTLESNSLSEQGVIYPFTTLLVPLQHKPNISKIVVSPPPPSPSSPPSSSTPRGSSKKTWIYAVVGAVGGIALISLLLLGILVLYKRYPRSEKKDDPAIVTKSFEATEKPEGKKVGEESETLSEIISGIAQSFKVYGFKELQHATDNFSSSCCIKGGSVYCGMINGDLAAIKKMDGDVSTEIAILNKVNHSNVIRLSGVSFNEGHWFLVYEYATNGCLTDWIYVNNPDGKFLTWSQRMQIALDVATGLDYLHSFTSPPLIHKDLKTDNILLDTHLRAKIANLGLARSVEGEDDQFPMTRHIVGTRGYMAPEYLENGIVSTKQDVYAFGVVMLEMLSGKEVAAIHSEDKGSLWDVLSVILDGGDEEKLRDFMDPCLIGKFPLELAVYVVRMIDNCLRKDPASRPAMHEIVSSLSVMLNSSLAWERSVTVSGDHNFCRSS